jgi:Fe-S-cluster-containing dehydrogenase component/anaerobic selenocysteine-containing dehydrogenase
MSESPKRYWMSLVGPDAPAEPDGDPDFITTRRSFLKAAGFTFAGAVASSCSRAPEVGAIPYVQQPEGLVAGRPVLYASTCNACEARCGLLVTNRDGRPVKIEGNADHPLSGGATCAIGQASLLGLYDSQRLAYPTRRGQRSTWAEVDREIAAALDRIRRAGGAVRILTPTITSPTAASVIADFAGTFKNARHVSYDPLSASAILEAHALTHGARLLPRYRFDRADAIVSFDADFLGTWISPVEYTRGYSNRRRIGERAPADARYHLQVESRLSLTGSNADRRLRVAPGEIGHVATHLAARLARRAGTAFVTAGLAPSISEPEIEVAADRLWAARGRALVVSGSQDVRVQVLCNFINQLVGAYGAYGATLDLERPSYQRQGSDGDLAGLRAELARGDVQALVVAGVNPAYDLPGGAGFINDLQRVPLLVSAADRLDETAALAQFVCPDHHYLESWSDAEAVSGVVSLAQPVVAPLRDTRSLIESLSLWTTGKTRTALDLVRGHWEQAIYPRAAAAPSPEPRASSPEPRVPSPEFRAPRPEPRAASLESFAMFWDRTLERGVTEIAAAKAPPAARPFDAGSVRPILRGDEPASGSFSLVLYPKIGMLDGRHGHNAWLHELPDPVTKVTWDNYACVSPAAARRLDLHDGDVVRVATEEGAVALELPAFVQPGMHDAVVAIAVGYGRAGTDRFAKVGPPWIEARPRAGVVGVAASAFVTFAEGARQNEGRVVTLVKTGRTQPLASTQIHHSLAAQSPPAGTPGTPGTAGTKDGGIIQEITSAELRAAPTPPHKETGDLWPADHEYSGHRWGMSIDLDSCTGCSACVIACQAENNIPVVGQDEVRRQREMHWLRIDRYYSGSDEAPEVAHQPMLCQHCDHAPCETVCPVIATSHTDEGLNEQVYNRCVGTRYCANNCPYKVRRFNWFDYPHEDRLQNLVFNPNVTVRSRGVMEKCTFCVQRIEETKIEARRTGSPLADGAIKTACEQVCPAEAIVFGDLHDPKSRVAALAGSRRAYRVLEDLGTGPAVRYLKLVQHD